MANEHANVLLRSDVPHTEEGEDLEGSDSGDEEDLSEADVAHQHEPDKAIELVPHSQAYIEFQQFLQLGCSGSPVQGYPTVVVIISTIPTSVSSFILFQCLCLMVGRFSGMIPNTGRNYSRLFGPRLMAEHCRL